MIARGRCFLLLFYIKPQPTIGNYFQDFSCFLLRFYIKPQHLSIDRACSNVVSYCVSTSNHNSYLPWERGVSVVSYCVSTSNHNDACRLSSPRHVVSYCVSTSNHNLWRWLKSWKTVVSYCVSTSNHNIIISSQLKVSCCFLLRFYIKPQPAQKSVIKRESCFLLRFYIKPQLFENKYKNINVVSYCVSTSNHNQPQKYEMLIKLFLIAFLHQTTT